MEIQVQFFTSTKGVLDNRPKKKVPPFQDSTRSAKAGKVFTKTEPERQSETYHVENVVQPAQRIVRVPVHEIFLENLCK